MKGKSAIARRFGGRQRNFTGEVFWARGFFVSTVGLDEQMVREGADRPLGLSPSIREMRFGGTSGAMESLLAGFVGTLGSTGRGM